MPDQIRGNVYVVGDDINTDLIIPARYLMTMDPDKLGKHAMEDLDPATNPVPFLNADGSCDYQIIVAGKNFGCGSSREHAPIALAAAGIQAVVAPSFARIFYRNGINGGALLPLVSTMDLTDKVKTGDNIEIQLSGSPSLQFHGDGGHAYPIRPFGPVKEIIDAGGLTAYNMAGGGNPDRRQNS
jgi:3-isopropylmalate/(R)-2-methylmalate dehydratase small subunit